MNIVCLDLEGVLVPEIWIAFSEESGIPELARTTRDEPDYDKLMAFRIATLREQGLGLPQIQDVMAKLGWPTLLCNSLEVAPSGEIVRHRMRCENSKLTTVRALQGCGFDTIAAGDSFNDLAMIRASRAGFLFRSTPQIKADNPDLPAFTEYADLLAAITEAL